MNRIDLIEWVTEKTQDAREDYESDVSDLKRQRLVAWNLARLFLEKTTPAEDLKAAVLSWRVATLARHDLNLNDNNKTLRDAMVKVADTIVAHLEKQS